MNSEKFIKMKTEFKSLPKEKQRKIIFNYSLLFIGLFMISTFLVGMMLKTMMEVISSTNYSIIHYSLLTGYGLICNLCVYLLILLLYFLYFTRKKLNNIVISTDERGVSFMKNGSNGSSAWMDEKEAKATYNVGNIKDIDTTVYGQLTTGGKEVVAYKYPKVGGTGDQNLLLIGSPGTGKSFAYVRTEMIQSIRRGDSIICTDPSGELQATIAKFAEDNGYKVKVLNLLEPSYSDFWNCTQEIIDPETERLDGTKLNSFVNIYMKNIEENNGKVDQFWFGASSNLLKATIGLTSWEREYYILDKFRTLYKHVAIKEANRDEIADTKFQGMTSFVKLKQLILEAADHSEFDLDEVQKAIDDIENNAPKFNIKNVFLNLMDFTNKSAILETAPLNHPGKIAYSTFMQSTDQVKQSTLSGMQIKMTLFSDEKLANILSYDGIDLSKINTEKTVVFVIISDKSTELKPITSLFFSFFFKDVQDVWDKNQQIADAKNEPNPCKKMTVMLDEFFSIGVIGGDPQSFGVTMSNSRKRQLHINIIVQGIKQLEALYGPDVASTIKTCCGTNLFLGCNDEDTAKYVSEFMCGEATVLSERHAESQSILGEFNSKFKDVQFSSTQRMLVTIEEAKSWKNKVLVSKRGEHPIKLNPFPWTDHPLAKKIQKTNIYERITPLSERMDVIEEIERKQKVEVSKVIRNLKPLVDISNCVLPVEERKKNEQISLEFDDVKNEPIQKKTKKTTKKTSSEKRAEKRSIANKTFKVKSQLNTQKEDMGSGTENIL